MMNSGQFGFTLVREHPKRERESSKETWYEFLNIENKIPSIRNR